MAVCVGSLLANEHGSAASDEVPDDSARMSPERSEVRVWNDASGHNKMTGRLLAIEKDKVRLQKDTGEVVVVPLDKLSTVDQQYVTARRTEQAATPVANQPVDVAPMAMRYADFLSDMAKMADLETEELITRIPEASRVLRECEIEFSRLFTEAAQVEGPGAATDKDMIRVGTHRWLPPQRIPEIYALLGCLVTRLDDVSQELTIADYKVRLDHARAVESARQRYLNNVSFQRAMANSAGRNLYNVLSGRAPTGMATEREAGIAVRGECKSAVVGIHGGRCTRSDYGKSPGARWAAGYPETVRRGNTLSAIAVGRAYRVEHGMAGNGRRGLVQRVGQ